MSSAEPNGATSVECRTNGEDTITITIAPEHAPLIARAFWIDLASPDAVAIHQMKTFAEADAYAESQRLSANRLEALDFGHASTDVAIEFSRDEVTSLIGYLQEAYFGDLADAEARRKTAAYASAACALGEQLAAEQVVVA
jgi:hypothetical protein